MHARAYDRPWTARDIAATLTDASGLVLCAGEPPLGFLLACVVADEAEILALAVAPEARRAGLGRRLVDACAARAAGSGAEAIWLEVAEDNAVARALYAGAGFREAGRRRGYYPRPSAEPVDALLLRRTLNRS